MGDLPNIHRLASLMLAIVLVSTIPATSALAHSMLLKAEPPRRAILTQSPAHVRLWFNEKIEGDYASLVVLDTNRQPITDIKPTLAPDDQKSILLPLPKLSPGKYTVKFRVLSVDGHVVDSSFDFTVKGDADRK